MPQLEERLQIARTTGCLVLNNISLPEIPNAVFEIANLQILILGNSDFAGGKFNRITTLPDTLSRLPQLCLLDLRKNQIREIPASLLTCGQLHDLQKASEVLNAEKQRSINNRQYERAADLRDVEAILARRYAHDPTDWAVLLGDNPITHPPLEVVEAGYQAIRSFFAKS